MKQLRHWTKHYNLDMTECKLNVIVDRDGEPHIMCSFPKKWREGREDEGVPKGDKFKIFEITEWDEVELMVKP